MNLNQVKYEQLKANSILMQLLESQERELELLWDRLEDLQDEIMEIKGDGE